MVQQQQTAAGLDGVWSSLLFLLDAFCNGGQNNNNNTMLYPQLYHLPLVIVTTRPPLFSEKSFTLQLIPPPILSPSPFCGRSIL